MNVCGFLFVRIFPSRMPNLTKSLFLSKQIAKRVLRNFDSVPCSNKITLLSNDASGLSRIERRYAHNTSSKPSSSSYYKYFAALALGATGYYLLHDKLNFNKDKKAKENDNAGPLLRLDLNDVYEKTALLFLSNPDFRETLGMPIKVTSSESDEVRTLNLRREGETVYSFIAYNVAGTQNSGTVYCKLIMDKDTQHFNAESIFLKLNKPDKNNRTEIALKATGKQMKNENDVNFLIKNEQEKK